MHSILKLLSLASLLACVPDALAGFSSSSKTNVAVYWGQNSFGQASSQQRLSAYCSSTDIDIIPLAFLITIANPSLNFANAGNNCTAISGSNLFSCPQLEADIAECQSSFGKTILLSVGGSTYTEGGFSSSSAAVAAATNIWEIFGPETSSSVPRPFGSSVIDGFDFDFESTVTNMAPFANQLRSLMTVSTASTGKSYYLSAAPQCPYPDSADNQMLDGAVPFDFIMVQFYNNFCGLQSFTAGSSTQNNFDFSTWDNWAKTVSANPNVKVLLGVPGNTGAAGSGYESGSTLASIISYSKSFSSFGGAMIWDMSQVFQNPGFLPAVKSDVEAAASSTIGTTMTTVTTQTTTGTLTSAAATSTATNLVNEWNQCGGEGWTGGTVCVSPFVCTELSVWYSQCE